MQFSGSFHQIFEGVYNPKRIKSLEGYRIVQCEVGHGYGDSRWRTPENECLDEDLKTMAGPKNTEL